MDKKVFAENKNEIKIQPNEWTKCVCAELPKEEKHTAVLYDCIMNLSRKLNFLLRTFGFELLDITHHIFDLFTIIARKFCKSIEIAILRLGIIKDAMVETKTEKPEFFLFVQSFNKV